MTFDKGLAEKALVTMLERGTLVEVAPGRYKLGDPPPVRRPTPSALAIVAGKALDEYAADLFARVTSMTGARAVAVSALRDLDAACVAHVGVGRGRGNLPEWARWRGGTRCDFAHLADILAKYDVYSAHIDWLADDVRRWGREWAALDEGGCAA